MAHVRFHFVEHLAGEAAAAAFFGRLIPTREPKRLSAVVAGRFGLLLLRPALLAPVASSSLVASASSSAAAAQPHADRRPGQLPIARRPSRPDRAAAADLLRP